MEAEGLDFAPLRLCVRKPFSQGTSLLLLTDREETLRGSNVHHAF